MCKKVTLAVMLIILITVYSLASQTNTDTRLAKPSLKEFKIAEELVQKILNPDVELLKEKKITYSQLAEKCANFAKKSEKPATKWILYQKAGILFNLDLEFEKALSCYINVDNEIRGFNIKEEIQSGVEKACKNPSRRDVNKIVDFCLNYAEKLLNEGKIDESEMMITYLKSNNLLELKLNSMGDYIKFKEKLLKEKEVVLKLLKYKQKLSSSPNDPEANYQYALLLIDDLNSFEEALTFFAKGSDSQFAPIATLELKKDKTNEQINTIANYYWERSLNKTDKLAPFFQTRAINYYTQIVNDVTGLNKALINQKLQSIQEKESNATPKSTKSLDLDVKKELSEAEKKALAEERKAEKEEQKIERENKLNDCNAILKDISIILKEHKNEQKTLDELNRRYSSSSFYSYRYYYSYDERIMSWQIRSYAERYNDILAIHKSILEIANDDPKYKNAIFRIEQDITALKANYKGLTSSLKTARGEIYRAVKDMESLHFKVRTMLLPLLKK